MTAAAAMQLQQRSTASALTSKPAPMADPTAQDSSSSATGAGSATITANDFLTLLVTEMKNQDPTANTDPNEYINQLVQVNSLQQLISINEVLSSSLGTSSTATGATQAAAASRSPHAPIAAQAANPTATPAAVGATAVNTPASIAGNLSVPAVHSSAQRLAHALDGSASAARIPGLPVR
jgi:flagellar basal-body rod modification protein FlgD